MTSTAATRMAILCHGHRPESVVRPSSLSQKTKAVRTGTNQHFALAIRVRDAVARSAQPEARRDRDSATHSLGGCALAPADFAIATGLYYCNADGNGGTQISPDQPGMRGQGVHVTGLVSGHWVETCPFSSFQHNSDEAVTGQTPFAVSRPSSSMSSSPAPSGLTSAH